MIFYLVNSNQGMISIDGVATDSVPLGRLRASISVIPQDPVLFRYRQFSLFLPVSSLSLSYTHCFCRKFTSILIYCSSLTVASGSVRRNLDPWGVKDDHALWQALEVTQLKRVC